MCEGGGKIIPAKDGLLTVQNSYNAARAKEAAHAVLGPLGLALEDFNENGRAALGEQNVREFDWDLTDAFLSGQAYFPVMPTTKDGN